MRKSVFLIFFWLVFLNISAADIVTFNNKDRLSGKLERLEDAKLFFDSGVSGKITVDIAQVSNLSTDEPVEIHLIDGTVFKSRILACEPGRFAVEETKFLPAQSFAFSDLAAINPPPKPKAKWTGNITAGLTSTHGNTFTENANISFNAVRRSERDRTRAFGSYLVSRQEDQDTSQKQTTEETFTLGGKYDYFLSEKLYSYFNANFKKDHIADLDRRIIAGFGVGYQWIESEKMNFSHDVGLAQLCEKYTESGDITTNDELSLQLGYHFDYKINNKYKFLHNLTYYPSIGSPSDYFLTADAELQLSLTSSMFGSFKAILDYDATPAENVGKTDTKYILGFGWSF